jgi:hypothetical protein
MMRKWRFLPTLFSLALVVASSGSAQADPIGPEAFGPGTILESFEGIVVGPNVGPSAFGYLIVGTVGPYTFPTGVILTQPIPGAFTRILSGDFARGVAPWDLGNNGRVGAANVPLGTAYLGLNNLSPGTIPFVEFVFPNDVLRVGALVDAAAGGGQNNMITMTVLDVNSVVLESFTIAGTPVANWGNNFIGLQQSGIRRVRFSGDFEILDGLRWEAAGAAIPEPGTLTLLGIGLAVLGAAWSGQGVWQRKRAGSPDHGRQRT